MGRRKEGGEAVLLVSTSALSAALREKLLFDSRLREGSTETPDGGREQVHAETRSSLSRNGMACVPLRPQGFRLTRVGERLKSA